MKLIACCTIAAAMASCSASATGLPARMFDFDVWAATVLKENGIEGARVVDTAFPISFSYCPKGSPELWRYQAISASQLEALNRGGELATDVSSFELLDASSAVCGSVKS